MKDSGTEWSLWMSNEVGIERFISSKADGSKDWKNVKTLELQVSQMAEREQLRGIRPRDFVIWTDDVRKSKKNGLD